MTAKGSKAAPPAGLDAAGKELWDAVLSDLDTGWELDARELHFLEQACRCGDDMASLEEAVATDGRTITGSRGQTITHPALSEIRQLRGVQRQLLSSIELVDPEKAIKAATPATARARRAADARWTGSEKRRAAHG